MSIFLLLSISPVDTLMQLHADQLLLLCKQAENQFDATCPWHDYLTTVLFVSSPMWSIKVFEIIDTNMICHAD